MKMYAVYDKLAKEAGFVFENKNDETAARAYRQYMEKGNRDKADYDLYYVGEFFSDKMHLEPSASGPVRVDVTVKDDPSQLKFEAVKNGKAVEQ